MPPGVGGRRGAGLGRAALLLLGAASLALFSPPCLWRGPGGGVGFFLSCSRGGAGGCRGPVLWAAAQPVPVVEVDTPDGVEFVEASPMGFGDISALFPFSGPFAPDDEEGGDGSPGDQMLHDMFSQLDRTFADQLLPVIKSRYGGQNANHPCYADVNRFCPHSDAPLHCLGQRAATDLSGQCREEIKHTVPFVCSWAIDRWCQDNLDQGVISCLEKHGSDIGEGDCADAIVATRHAVKSLQTTVRNPPKSRKDPGKKGGAPPPPACPTGFSGGGTKQSQGCCTRTWSRACDRDCSKDICLQAPGGWEWRWLDFRNNPYTCCPKKPPKKAYLGGQALCPLGWKYEKSSNCCRKGWTWDCGQTCAEDQCLDHTWNWWKVNVQVEPYKCCAMDQPRADSLAVDRKKPVVADKEKATSKRRSESAAAAKAVLAQKARSGDPADDTSNAIDISWLFQSNAQSWSWWFTGLGVVCACSICFRRKYLRDLDDKEL